MRVHDTTRTRTRPQILLRRDCKKDRRKDSYSIEQRHDFKPFHRMLRHRYLTFSVAVQKGQQHRLLQADPSGSNESQNGHHAVAVAVGSFFATSFAFFFAVYIIYKLCRILGECDDERGRQLRNVTNTATSSNPQLPEQPRIDANVTSTARSAATAHNRQSLESINANLSINPIEVPLEDVGHRQQVEYRLVTTRFNEQETTSHKDCIICLDSFQTGDEVAGSVNPECRHLFHTKCIVEWLLNHTGCPQCRRNFFDPVVEL